MSTAMPQGNGKPFYLPLVYCWREENPLPIRVIRVPGRSRLPERDGPPWLPTGPTGQPFDFCGHIQRLCADIVARCEFLHHVDISQVLFAVTQARTVRAHGLQARVTPLRLRGGRLTRQRRGRIYQVQQYFLGDCEILYLVTFCLPRFLDLSFDEKFITLFHELFHISPAFDGDLRRHNGRYCVHSHSKKQYDQHMAALARAYLTDGADPDLHAFLRLDFAQLHHRHGHVIGTFVPRPKLVPLPSGSP